MKTIWTLKFSSGPSESYDTEQQAKDALWRQVRCGEARHITHVETTQVEEPKKEVPPVDTSARCTTDGKPFDPTLGENGQQKNYIILCDEERAKGFVRPVRKSYRHVGVRPEYPLVDLTEEEHERYDKFGYVKKEEYPKERHPVTGRYWTEKDLNSGCGAVTTMGQALAETYSRDPKFYGSTMCVGCGKHFPVEEFVWDVDNTRVGS